MGLENRMLKMISFRKENPWIAAHPFLDKNKWNYMKKEYYPLLIQDNEKLTINPSRDDSIPEDPYCIDGIIAETTLELHLQAFVNQVLGYISNYSVDTDDLLCGFAYFGFKNACPYQIHSSCKGAFPPNAGSKYPIEKNGNNWKGCTFEMFFEVIGVGESKNIDLNFNKYKFPSNDEVFKEFKELK